MVDEAAVYCSFCGKESADVNKMIAGPGVHICDGCVALCADILAAEQAKAADRGDAGSRPPRLPAWESMTDEQILEHLPRVARVSDQVEANLRSWVGALRARDVAWARIGEALGMTRQSAWERFARSSL
jgi:hypothetical protein